MNCPSVGNELSLCGQSIIPNRKNRSLTQSIEGQWLRFVSNAINGDPKDAAGLQRDQWWGDSCGSSLTQSMAATTVAVRLRRNQWDAVCLQRSQWRVTVAVREQSDQLSGPTKSTGNPLVGNPTAN